MNIRLLAQRLRDAAATVDRRKEVIWLFVNHISLFSCFFCFQIAEKRRKTMDIMVVCIKDFIY